MESKNNLRIFIAVSILVIAATNQVQAQFDGGAGEPNDPYQIWTAEQMNAIGADPNLWDKHFILMADIDLSIYGEEAFNTIGEPVIRTGFTPFRGVFDGNSHIIANFCKIGYDGRSIGLFRYVSDPSAEIKNLTLIHPSLDASTANKVGALVGHLDDGASISNCHVEDGVVLGKDNVGGLVGYCDYGSITECHATGIVIGDDAVGGLLGNTDQGYVDISRCYAESTVIGNYSVGGLIGCGGATNCYATSTVFGKNGVGGLVGISEDLQNCYAAGTVVANVPSDQGAFVGGLIGYYDDLYDEIVNCFYDLQVSGGSTLAAGVGKMTAQMRSSVTFQAWGEGDNAGVWTIDESRDYPRLAWEGRPGVPIEAASFGDIVAGSGTAEDPYLIETAQQFAILATSPEQWDCYFELTTDIDLAGTALPSIGTSEKLFTGVFDGNGHTLSGYRNIASDPECTGLFGYAGYGGRGVRERVVIKNLGLIEPIVNGGTCDNAAALVGCFVAGIITDCYVEGGFVLGGETSGGLVGRNYGTLYDCYANTSVLGNDVAGGLVGDNQYGEIINCYSTGFVLRQDNAGGLVGFGAEGELIESFWDIETSSQVTSNGGEGKTTAQLHDPNTFIAAGWDLCGSLDEPDGIWMMGGESRYPVLWWQVPAPIDAVFSGGDGTAEAPYLIDSAEQLNRIGCNPRLIECHFSLISDIDLNGVGFSTIGNITHPFTGVFEGNGYVIVGLNYSNLNEDDTGLFSYVSGPGVVRNLGLVDPNVEAGTGDNVGSLVGYLLSGTVANCYATGLTVSGGDQTGGLVGYSGGSVTDCYATGTIAGHNQTGGLVGYNNGLITDCYATGIVAGRDRSGGLIGYNYVGSISDCYAACVVSGQYSTGGLAGYNRGGSITDCYTDIDIVGSNSVGGLAGYTSHCTIEKCSATGTVSGERYVGGLVGEGDYSSEIRECYAISDVVGNDRVGGLVGYGQDTIVNCCAAGAVGGDYSVGGLIGSFSGTVLNSYATGPVAGNDRVGGLVGYISGRIQTSYAIGPVTGTTYTGGLVGYNSGSDISCFWDMETSGQVASSGGTGRTTAEMQTAGTFLDAGWDFVGESDNGTEDIWWMPESDYPQLWWE